MSERVITLRELNRATLARQLLLERATLAPLAALQQVAGLQGQLANPPYMGLWSRVADFQRADLTCLLEQRAVVRTSLMRRTLHLVTVEDYLRFRPALRGLYTRALETRLNNGQDHGLAQKQLLAEMLSYVREQPRTNVELRARLAELLPALDERLMYDVRAHLEMIQVFPGGSWGVGGSPAYAHAPDWLGRAFVEPEAGLRALVRSYLTAFGPASLKDLQTWSGLSRLQTVLTELRPELVVLRDEQGRELFDLPGLPLPGPDTPAPVRFIPDFDNLVLAYDDRRRVVADQYRPIVFPGRSSVLPTFLVDGFVSGTWHIERVAPGARLVIRPFEPLSASVSQQLRAEGERLLAWAAERASSFEIEISAYNGKTGGQNMWGRL